MLVEADAVGLEVVGAGYLSQDKVLCQELRDEVDIHAANQNRFKLPDRITAKKFKFRLIYGGTAYAYSKDTDFSWISEDPDFWENVITEYYNKYSGMRKWHDKIYQDAIRNGKLVMPTGRVYTYKAYVDKRGEVKWPRTTILNYPVQGLGADLVSIARVLARKRLSKFTGVDFINTIHDSILVDICRKHLYNVVSILDKSFRDIPKVFQKLFNVEFNLPLRSEIKGGPNWGNLSEIKI